MEDRSGAVLAVHHEQPLTVGADNHRVRIPTGRNQTDHPAAPACAGVCFIRISICFIRLILGIGRGSPQTHHRDRVRAPVRDVESALIRRQGEAVWVGALPAATIWKELSRRRGMNLFENLIRRCIND